MILQILPVLLVPLQTIFNNVLEEALSCFYGMLCCTQNHAQEVTVDGVGMLAYACSRRTGPCTACLVQTTLF